MNRGGDDFSPNDPYWDGYDAYHGIDDGCDCGDGDCETCGEDFYDYPEDFGWDGGFEA